LPGFVDFLAGQADVGGSSFPDVPLRNVGAFPQVRAMLRDLAPFLRGVVFIGKAALNGAASQIAGTRR
jgi:hypothetical protein